MSKMIACVCAVATICACKRSDPIIINGDFESQESAPELYAWMNFGSEESEGAKLSRDRPRSGNFCALISGEGSIARFVTTSIYRTKSFALQAWIRLEKGSTTTYASMALEETRTGRSYGPILSQHSKESGKWELLTLNGTLNFDSENVIIVFMIKGPGKLFVDDVEMTIK